MIVLPADHVIRDTAAFQKAVHEGVRWSTRIPAGW